MLNLNNFFFILSVKENNLMKRRLHFHQCILSFNFSCSARGTYQGRSQDFSKGGGGGGGHTVSNIIVLAFSPRNIIGCVFFFFFFFFF